MPPLDQLARRMQPAPVRVLAVTGGKGGTGKTSVAINIASALAGEGREVLLLDGDLGLANVDVLLGLAPRYTLEHVLKGERQLEEIIVPARPGLRIVPAASGVARLAQLNCCEHHALIGAFQSLPWQPQVLVVDTAPGVSDSVLSFAQAAQEILVVIRNEPASLTDAYGLIKLLHRDHRVARFRVVVNQVRNQDEGARVFKRLHSVVERYLQAQIELAAVIPSDEHMVRAVRQQRAVVEAYPDCLASRALRQLAADIERWPLPSGTSGRIEFYLENLLAGARPTPGLRVVQ